MKILKQLIILTFTILLSSKAHAQLSLGGQFSYLKLLAGTGISNYGFSLKGDYAISEDLVVTLGGSYYLPYKISEATTAYALNNQEEQSSIVVNYDRKFPFTHVFLGVKKYWGGSYESDFGFYGLLEVGFLTTTVTSEYESYDKSKYMIDDDEKLTFANFMITAGLGFEANIDFAYLFTDFKFNLPANQENGREVVIEIPASITANLGVRVPLGQSTQRKGSSVRKSKSRAPKKRKAPKRRRR